MATVKATANKSVSFDESVIVLSWAGLAASGDLGDAQSYAPYADKTFIITGTFTGTPTVVIEGSNDGTNWVTLTNRQGNPMSFTAAGMNTSQDKPAFVRPNMTAGSGGANVTVSVCCHRTDLSVTAR